MLCAIIMAGGIGSRFWPQSTVKKPKQFLNLIGDKTMIQLTYDRIKKLIPEDNIFIVTNKDYVSLVKEQIPNINDINIITEPCGRNTAPCILLSSIYLKNLYGDVNVVCLSSDSYIEKEEEFLKKIESASNYILENKKAIVTLGITPTRAETGYGYIKFENGSNDIKKVLQFVEKPDIVKANEYFKSGEYLWNAGMFIFNNLEMIKEIKENDTVNYELLKDLPDIADKNYHDFLNRQYEKCNKISIDYAVMEKSKNVYTIPSSIGWDDVGSWMALSRYTKEDQDNNILKGDIEVIDSHNNVVYGNNKKIILLNMDDIFCIDSDDALIIGKKEDIKEVAKLKDRG